MVMTLQRKASISYTDYNIGQILNKLEEVGHKDDTIAIVFGDHGYQLGEVGAITAHSSPITTIIMPRNNDV